MNRRVAIAAVALAVTLPACNRLPSPAAPAAARDPIQAAEVQAQKAPSFENYTSLGLAYSQAGRHREALGAFEHSREISPTAPIAYNNLCAEHNALEEQGLAQADCRRALELQPDLLLAKNNLAAAERGLASLDARIGEMKKNISQGHDVDGNRVNLGLVYYQRGSTEDAVSVWKLVPERSPQFAVAQNDLASAYIVLKKFDRAREALDRALKLDPNNALFQNNARWLASASHVTH